jgi:pSer/pThr/pTyr-binding forkhead associated (FHA) protein
MAKPTRCPRCGRENDPSLAFCLDCGQSLRDGAGAAAPGEPGACAACGEPLQPSFRFCGQCGHPVGPARPAPAAPPVGAGPTGTGFHQTVSAPRPPAAPQPLRAVPAPRPASAAQRGALRLAAVRHDGLPGTVFPLPDGETVCGRSEGALRLGDDATVSPRHARFTLERGRLTVEDQGSVNGTYLRIQAPRRLAVGEEIRIGRQLLRLEPLPPGPDERGARPWGAPDPGYRMRLSQLLEGGGVGEVFPLHEGENTVGRDAGEVTFPGDRYVSARHARVDVFGGAVTLTDVGSSNGTFVRIAGATPLEPGDQLLVGGQLLRVEG